MSIPAFLARNAVLCNKLCSPEKQWNCFGYNRRDTGQSRVPEPPERITGTILLEFCDIRKLANICFSQRYLIRL